MADNKVWKAVKPYVNGGASGMMATCIIQPIDMVKVRLQLGATGGPVSVMTGMRSRTLQQQQLLL
jgi:solute carrier family 25 oxoglutarate transporter 11